MKRLSKFLIRISSFVSKELTEILRQPRLILTLVFGPFLIMFLFGLGYPEQNRTLRTTFVAEDQSALQGNMELFTGSASPAIADQDIESDKDLALAKLALNQTDIVIVIPESCAARPARELTRCRTNAHDISYRQSDCSITAMGGSRDSRADSRAE